MLPIPKDLNSTFNSLLYQKAIPEKDHPYYRKWLRYYLDFCQKYGFRQSDTKSVKPFINKLKEKNQTDLQQKQAVDAIKIYHGQNLAKNGQVNAFKPKNGEISSKKESLKSTGASWVPEYTNLNAEIKLRHYSKSTLRTNTHTVKSQTIKEAKSPLDF